MQVEGNQLIRRERVYCFAQTVELCNMVSRIRGHTARCGGSNKFSPLAPDFGVATMRGQQVKCRKMHRNEVGGDLTESCECCVWKVGQESADYMALSRFK